jgi:hypothetical protein
MNCENFENVIVDIARGQLIGASLREEATLHTRACPTCAARLARQQNLTVALKALVLLDENQKADHQIEANLLSAFRNQAKTNSLPPAVISELPQRPTRSRRVYWWAAAAALILLTLSLVALRLQNHKPTPQPQIVHQQSPENQTPQNQDATASGKSGQEEVAPGSHPATPQKQVEAANRNLNHRADRHNRQLVANRPKANPGTVNHKPAEEIATNFIPLYNIPMTEGGQLVRVELPRSALASFGLPINTSVADKPIKADVVIGYDGIARAIRFVQ